MTISVTEDEIDGIGGENIVGAYACMKYFQSLKNDNNKAFVPAFHKMWGDKTVIGDVTQAAYLGPWLWKLTVEKAGSFDIDKIAAASPGVEFKGAPEGYVRIHENHHLWSKTRVGRARADGQYDVIYETADLMEPDPVPEGLPVSERSAIVAPASCHGAGATRPKSVFAAPDCRAVRQHEGAAHAHGLFARRMGLDPGDAGLLRPDPVLGVLLMALGLAIIFGQMGVINMAHGEFMILGAYMTYLCSHLCQTYVPALYPGYFFVAMVVAFIVSGRPRPGRSNGC